MLPPKMGPWLCSADYWAVPTQSISCTCHKVSKADGAEGDEAIVDGLGEGPALLQLEHNHGHNKEEHCSAQVRHQVDKEAGTLLPRDAGGRIET